MSVGEGALFSGLSYVALGQENTFGTYNTCTAGLPVLSSSLKTMQENKILEEIQASRTHSKRISTTKKVEGDLEFYAYPECTALAYLIKNAFGGSVVSATATGETAGGAAFTHTFAIGNFDQSVSSLCANVRKGDSASGKLFGYSGLRVNELMFSAEIDEALKGSASLIGLDSTSSVTDVADQITTGAYTPLSFVNGRISVETSFAGLTSTSFWHVQSVEFGHGNSLKNDSNAGRIGSRTLTTLPPGIVAFTLNMTVRFDTTTAYDAMLNETQLSAELDFLGDTLSTSVIRRGLKMQYPKIFISEAGDPEIGGPDEVLTAEIVCHVLRDDSSAGGYAARALLTNNIASY